MIVTLTDSDRQHLRQLQKQRRDEQGYVRVTVILLLDKGRSAGSIAEDLGLDDGTVYRYAQAWQRLGLEKCLAARGPGLLEPAAFGWAGGPEPGSGADALHRRAPGYRIAINHELFFGENEADDSN